jgi:hypothetical protein
LAQTWPGWDYDVLQQIGGPSNTSSNDFQLASSFLKTWNAHEGSPSENNPLSTTRDCCGGVTCAKCDSAARSAGVKDYPDPFNGARATGGALTNGRYPTIVEYLRHPWNLFVVDPRNQKLNDEIHAWGTTDWSPAATAGHSSEGTASDWTSFDFGSIFGGLLDWLDALKKIVAFVIWLLQPKHWLQAIELLIGVALILLGLSHVGRLFSAESSTTAAIAAGAKALATPSGRASAARRSASQARRRSTPAGRSASDRADARRARAASRYRARRGA